MTIPSPKPIYRQRTETAQYFYEPLSDDGFPLQMMLIPAGTFEMGSPDDEPQREYNEGPKHEVRVSAFCMGRHPVIQAQWCAVAAMPKINQALDPDPSYFKSKIRPVERVSWFDAVEFCARLSAHTGRAYRLPSEAEWEYACRAMTITPFHFGQIITPKLANYGGTFRPNLINHRGTLSYVNDLTVDSRSETTHVGVFEVFNAFGLSDMHGNVREWCADHWHDNYQGAPLDGSVWLSENESAARVLRGGSWEDNPSDCRSAMRFHNSPISSNINIGFRVVCSAPGSLP